MELPVKTALICLCLGVLNTACSPLPRVRNFYSSLDKWPVSGAATGLVLFSTDSSYTSTDVYFYNFGSGELSPLTLGESGDAAGKWDGRRLWLFNRAVGRVSYSMMSPKSGSSSRSVERRTPEANASDPTDWVHMSDVESVLAMGTSGKVAVANLVSGIAIANDLGDVDTSVSGVPFRPGVLWRRGEEVAVFHQSLNAAWKADGGGRIFIARRGTAGAWGWVDQDVTTLQTQGVPLNVSDPVAVFDCDGETCFIAGACYDTSGDACVGGVDEWTWATRSVEHHFNWPFGTVIAGGIAAGPKTGQVIACLKNSTDVNARLVVLDALTGVQSASWDAGAASCGPFKVDHDGRRVFAVKQSNGVSILYSLNAELAEISHVSPRIAVSALEIVSE